MAVGDVKADTLTIASGATTNIQPTGTEEWVIHNLYREDGITLLRSDGTGAVLFETVLGKGWNSNMFLHVTNLDFLAIRNDQIVSKKVSYDGVQTKV